MIKRTKDNSSRATNKEEISNGGNNNEEDSSNKATSNGGSSNEEVSSNKVTSNGETSNEGASSNNKATSNGETSNAPTSPEIIHHATSQKAVPAIPLNKSFQRPAPTASRMASWIFPRIPIWESLPLSRVGYTRLERKINTTSFRGSTHTQVPVKPV